MATKINPTTYRFAAVGVLNTLIDFGLLFTLKALGLPAIGANVISTGVAFVFSFFANKNYTFKTTDTNVRREIVLFIIVTLFGLWVLQTLVIKLLLPLAHQLPVDDQVALLFTKLVASLVSLTWNYILYSKLVFVQENKS